MRGIGEEREEGGRKGRERTRPPCYRCIRAKPYSLPFPLPLPPRHLPFAIPFPLSARTRAPATLLRAEPFRDRTLQDFSQWCSSNPASAGPFCHI